MNASYLLAQAATSGDVGTVRTLLADDPRLVHSHSHDGWTPLHLAAHFGHLDVAEALLASGADVNARARNDLASTPLLWAVMGQQTATTELLLDHQADVNTPNTAGATPLHKAAVLGNLALVELLLARGANVHVRNTGGQTPLVHALYHGYVSIVALLEQHAAATSEVTAAL